MTDIDKFLLPLGRVKGALACLCELGVCSGGQGLLSMGSSCAQAHCFTI